MDCNACQTRRWNAVPGYPAVNQARKTVLPQTRSPVKPPVQTARRRRPVPHWGTDPANPVTVLPHHPQQNGTNAFFTLRHRMSPAHISPEQRKSASLCRLPASFWRHTEQCIRRFIKPAAGTEAGFCNCAGDCRLFCQLFLSLSPR